LRRAYLKCLGAFPERIPLRLRLGKRIVRKGYVEQRIVFESEKNADVSCVLLLPDGRVDPPVAICLQGHNTGMHISLAETKYPGDEYGVKTGRDYAIQAVRHGMAALCIEQRCFGERQDMRDGKRSPYKNEACHHASMNALLLGRTMIGERVWDVVRAVDLLSELGLTDPERILCMGDSGGGIISYYAAAADKRISCSMPICGFAPYAESIGRIQHCEDNYLPSALRYFDMQDLSGLIAPRPLLIVTGKYDPYFPLKAVESGCRTIKAIYGKVRAPASCGLVVGPRGHEFYPDLAWPVLKRMWPDGFR
jgi:cephalosporin-C deacetylase-like acetyl esterase